MSWDGVVARQVTFSAAGSTAHRASGWPGPPFWAAAAVIALVLVVVALVVADPTVPARSAPDRSVARYLRSRARTAGDARRAEEEP